MGALMLFIPWNAPQSDFFLVVHLTCSPILCAFYKVAIRSKDLSSVMIFFLLGIKSFIGGCPLHHIMKLIISGCSSFSAASVRLK